MKVRKPDLDNVICLYEMFEMLHDVPGTVKPVAVMNGTFEDGCYLKNDKLVFPVLAMIFYGCSSCLINLFVLRSGINTLKKFLRCGVIHVDAYPNNMFWRDSKEGSVEIRVVDWDVASFKGEEIEPAIYKRVKTTENAAEYYWNPHNDRASPMQDAWFDTHIIKMNETERGESFECGRKKSIAGVNVVLMKCIARRSKD